MDNPLPDTSEADAALASAPASPSTTTVSGMSFKSLPDTSEADAAMVRPPPAQTGILQSPDGSTDSTAAPSGPSLAGPDTGKGLWESFRETANELVPGAVSAKDRNLELEEHPDIFLHPKFWDRSLKGALHAAGVMGQGNENIAAAIKDMEPGAKVEKIGKYIKVTNPDGSIYTGKPGVRPSDIVQGLTVMAALTAGNAGVAALGARLGAPTAATAIASRLPAGLQKLLPFLRAAGVGATQSAVQGAGRQAAGGAPLTKGEVAAGGAIQGAFHAAGDYFSPKPVPGGGAPLTGDPLKNAMLDAASGNPEATQAVVNSVQPNAETVKALKDEGLNHLAGASTISDNESFRNISGALAHKTGALAATENAANKEIFDELSQKFEKLGGKYGTDVAAYSDESKKLTRDLIDTAKGAEKGAYDELRGTIGTRPANPGKTISALEEKMKKFRALGDPLDALSAEEKKVYNALKPRRNPDAGKPGEPPILYPTVNTLNDMKKKVSGGLASKMEARGEFSNGDIHELGNMASNLAEDELAAASRYKMRPKMEAAHKLTESRKTVEGMAEYLHGKSVEDSLVPQASRVVKALASGDSDQIKSFVSNVLPKQRQDVVGSTLAAAFTSGSAERPFEMGRFLGFMDGLEKSPTAKGALLSNLPAGAPKLLDNTYKILSGIKRSVAGRTNNGALLEALGSQGPETALDRATALVSNQGLHFLPGAAGPVSFLGKLALGALRRPKSVDIRPVGEWLAAPMTQAILKGEVPVPTTSGWIPKGIKRALVDLSRSPYNLVQSTRHMGTEPQEAQ